MMLPKGRFDQQIVDPNSFTIFPEIIPDKAYYFAVLNSPLDKEVAELWDKTMAKLYQSGELVMILSLRKNFDTILTSQKKYF